LNDRSNIPLTASHIFDLSERTTFRLYDQLANGFPAVPQVATARYQIKFLAAGEDNRSLTLIKR
jgi:hypothetical protein